MTTTLRIIVAALFLIGFSTADLVPGPGSALAAEEAAAPADTVREEVAKPLKEAAELTAAKQHKEALAKIDEADAVPAKTPYESYVISRNRGAAAFAAGNADLAAKSFDAAIATNRLTKEEILDISRALAVLFYNKPDHVNAAVWAVRYLEKGGPESQIKVLLAQSYFLRNDCANAATVLQKFNREDEAAGRVMAESQLQLWANCEMKLNHNAELVMALEKLVIHFPKKSYWTDLVRRMQVNPAFAERLALDAYRLQSYAGVIDNPEEYLDMAGLAMQAGFPAEARKVLDKGVADKLLATTEVKVKKLQEQVSKGLAEDLKAMPQDEQRATAAKTGVTPVNIGFNFVLHGQFDKGIALIEQGIAKGGLKYPEDAKLKLAVAYLYAGQKDKAVQAFKSIVGTDGIEVLARLWLLRISQG
jgi:tetratricopeptide (TPR) repeat protein